MRIDARVTLIFTVEQRGVREGNYVMQLYFLTGTLQETAALTLKAVKKWGPSKMSMWFGVSAPPFRAASQLYAQKRAFPYSALSSGAT